VSNDSAAGRFWLELDALYRAAGRPTLRRLVHLGLEQHPPVRVSSSAINDWLNRKAVPTGPKNIRYLTVMVAFLQARVRPDAGYERLPAGEWGRLLQAALAERAAGRRTGRPRRPDTSSRGANARESRPMVIRAREQAQVAPAPLIGRGGELAVLARLVAGVASGRGSVVLVDGEPGIGKSALLRAALTGAASHGCQVFWGTGSELDQALPLAPLLDGLRVREPSAGPRREKIAGFLRGEVGVDRGLDGPAVLAEQLLALIAEECAARPTVLVIDDLQWVDQASVRLLARLAGSARDLPLLLAGTMRPVPQRDDLLALGRAGDAVRLQLTGLPEAAVAEMVACLAGGVPDDRLLKLAGDAAGNPLYVTELVAALGRSSQLAVTGGGMATLIAGPAPRSLAAAINDRLGFISGPAREVLRSASLLGVEFAVTDLATLLDSGISDLSGILGEACAAGVLTETRNRLRFRHPLIHGALHEEMPAPIRAAWHREAGRALARAGAPADQVARQLLSAAGEPPEPMEEWILSWLDEAAAALVSQAPSVAARLLARALDSIPPSSARYGALASRLASALYYVGENAAAEQAASQALEHAADPDLLVDLHWTLALCRMAAGMPAESLMTLDRALAGPGLSARHRGRLLVLVARTHANSGELEKADRAAVGALEAASAEGDTWTLGWALAVMAGIATSQGQLTDALALYDRGLSVTQGDPALSDLRLLLRINKAAALANFDRWEEALAVAYQAQHLADQAGTTIRQAQAHGILGQLLFESGRWDDALAEISTVPESIKESGVSCVELGIAAVISFHRGDTAAARGYLSAAVPHERRVGRRLVPTLALARSLDHEQAGAHPEALAELTGWLDGGTEEFGHTQDLIGDAARLAMRTGDPSAARTLASQAATPAIGAQTPYRQANALYCRGLVEHDAAMLLSSAERYGHAARPLQRAKALEAATSEYARAGDWKAAQSTLAAAAEIYAWLGAIVDAARVKAARETHAAVATGNGAL
jgi:tetratricopeptide (TPR) repeat protein